MKTYVYKRRLLKCIIAIFDAVGYFLKWALSFFKKRNTKQIERILIFKLDHAGDVLLATPAIKAIRKQFPLAHITLVIGPWSKGIVEGETIRSLTIFSTVLETLDDMFDPLLPHLIWGKIIDEIYIPEDGENNSRHLSARKLAKRMQVKVCSWKPPSRIGARRL